MPRGSILTEIPVPTQGARSDVPRHRLPPDAMSADDASNVVIRDGWLVNRPGFSAINSTLVSGRPMGVTLFKTGASSKFLVVGTTTKLYKLNGAQTGWDDLTGPTALTGSADDPISFTVFPQGGSDYLIAANGVNVPQEWDGVAGTFVDSGTLPVADDLTTAANRVLLLRTIESGTRYNFRVRWSNFNVRGTSDSANFADLSDTPDILVGGRALSRVQVAIYKEASQWIGVAQSGSQPFRFDLRDSMPGPVSPAAVVVADGRHYYMGRDGSFYTFDGVRGFHIGEPIRRWVLANLNMSKLRRCFGVYLRRDRDIYWIFPAPTTDDPAVAVSYNLDTGRFFRHSLAFSVSCGADWEMRAALTWADLAGYTWATVAATYPTWSSFGTASIPVAVLGGTNLTVFQFGIAATDDGTAPTATWRSLLPLHAKSKRARIQSMESYFEQTAAALTVTVNLQTQDHVATAPTTPTGLSTTFDISQNALFAFDVDTAAAGAGSGTAEARFAALQHSVTSTINWKWGGAVLRSYPMETGNA